VTARAEPASYPQFDRQPSTTRRRQLMIGATTAQGSTMCLEPS
jgi:hypothetical protein